jgi:hypothetical protein
MLAEGMSEIITKGHQVQSGCANTLLVVIHNLNIRWAGTTGRPLEANPPLLVDAAKLAGAIAAQRLQPISRQGPQCLEMAGQMRRPCFGSYPPALGADRRSSSRHHASRRLRAAPAGVS